MTHTQPTHRQTVLLQWLKITITALVMLILITLTTSSAQAQDSMQLEIPSIGVNAPVVTIHIEQMPNGQITWNTNRLRMNIGYLEGTALPGTGGNVVLGGHSVLNNVGDVFYRLDEVEIGDEIYLNCCGTTYTYVVVNKYTVSEMDLTPIMPTEHEQLTLITCDIPSSDGVYYPQRDIIVAVPK